MRVLLKHHKFNVIYVILYSDMYFFLKTEFFHVNSLLVNNPAFVIRKQFGLCSPSEKEKDDGITIAHVKVFVCSGQWTATVRGG